MDQQGQQIAVNINEDIKKGRYANSFTVTRSQEEFTLDFMFIHAQTGGDYVARVIVTPVFLQQIADLLADQSKQPVISRPNETVTQKIGFKPSDQDSKQQSSR